jgi:drug/metabolite transporter (DMT)-like permease
MPAGLMPVAIKLMIGGAALCVVSPLVGEAMLKTPGWPEWGAFLYLMLLGMLVGFTAYLHLLRRTKPALATSYAFVNPVLTTLLGWWLLGEEITSRLIVSGAIIVASVVLIAATKRPTSAARVEEVAPAELEVPTTMTADDAHREAGPGAAEAAPDATALRQ